MITKVLPILSSVLVALHLSGQVSNNMALMASIDGIDNQYSDVWGYVHAGSEYAVITGRTSIHIYRVDDCASPQQVYANTGLDYTVWRDCKDYGDYVYCCDDDGQAERMWIINKDTYADTMHSASNMVVKAHNIFIDTLHGRLYAVGVGGTSTDRLKVYDLNANPVNPPILAELNLQSIVDGIDPNLGGWYIHDMYVKDHIGFASHGWDGLRIWDFSDLNNVELLGSYISDGGDPNQGWYNHSSWLHSSDSILYVAYEVPVGVPVEVVDISDLTAPTVLFSFSDPNLAPAHTDAVPHNPFVINDKLYISYYEDGMKVYDVSDPLVVPPYIAHYDTYPTNNDYNGYKGNWGVYPFLPSGCILASDISTGLYTLKETYPPTSVIEVADDLLFTPASDNLILRDLYDNGYTLQVEQITNSISVKSAPLTAAQLEADNADLYFSTHSKGPIINQNGQYYRIIVDSGGDLVAQPFSFPPSNLPTANAPMLMSSYAAGVILTDPSANCWKLSISDWGGLRFEQVTCP